MENWNLEKNAMEFGINKTDFIGPKVFILTVIGCQEPHR